MINRLEMVGLFVIAGIVAAMAAPVWRPQDGAVLPLNKARQLLRQCSRGAPQNITGVWRPEPGHIRDLEARLPALLEKALSGKPHPPVARYARQYAGFAQKDRRFIYVNGFQRGLSDVSNDWRKDAVMVCDGGNSFFGVEYDPGTKTFLSLGFNGVA